jgi:heavy metal sensor kinase
VFSLALAALGTSVWMLVRQRLLAESEQQLQERAATVEHFLAAQNQNLTIDQIRDELREEYETEDQVAWLQILDQNGNWLFRSHSMEQFFPAASHPGKLALRGKRWQADANHQRLLVLEKPIILGRRQYTVETASFIDGVYRSLKELELVFFWLAPGFMLIAALGSYFISKRALATVDAITATARSISDRNLDARLPLIRSGDELQRLSETLNEMLERIERSFERTRRFTADASHELRTPMSLIRTEAEIALRKTRTADEYRQALTHILSEAERTSVLIESLLTLARTDSGAELLHLHPLMCVALLRTVAEDWNPVFAEAQLTFDVAIPAAEIRVNADESALRRVLTLLLDNARKYTPPGGRVVLRAQIKPDEIEISVEDSGIGIEREDLAHIFDRFYRVDKSRSRAQRGAGLGLSLAQWIAMQHHTEIVVESTPGQGSRFSFALARLRTNPSTDIHSDLSETNKVL